MKPSAYPWQRPSVCDPYSNPKLHEGIMVIRACIFTEGHLKAALEMISDNAELRSVIPLLERALIEVNAIRQTQTLLLKCANGRDR